MAQSHGELFILAGVTASGKTQAALDWASSNDAEILSCDSISLYKGMDIGSAKPTAEQRKKVPHHGIDLFEVRDPCDVAQYAQFAKYKVDEVVARGRKILVVGGSGFYLQSFFARVADETEVEEQVRKKVEDLFNARGLDALLEKLRILNPKGLGGLDLHNPRRVVRALERCLSSGKSLSDLNHEFNSLPTPFPNLQKRFLWLDREDSDLEQRIGKRTKKMLEEGLLEETQRLLKLGLSMNPAASSSIGYREVISCLRGILKESDLESSINASTRKLVSKQRKWFRKHFGEHSNLVLGNKEELGINDLLWESGA